MTQGSVPPAERRTPTIATGASVAACVLRWMTALVVLALSIAYVCWLVGSVEWQDFAKRIWAPVVWRTASDGATGARSRRSLLARPHVVHTAIHRKMPVLAALCRGGLEFSIDKNTAQGLRSIRGEDRAAETSEEQAEARDARGPRDDVGEAHARQSSESR